MSRGAGGNAPRKSLGQNFLTDEEAARTVVRQAGIAPGSQVVEIGPGRGFLTRALLAAGAQVTAVEKDRNLAERLPQQFAGLPLEVIEGDFLETDLTPFSGRILVGNLPYYVAMPILSRALDHQPAFPAMVFMFQLEVAQRLCATPGGRTYGMPTLVATVAHEARQVRKVPAGAFFPKPRVDSALVRFVPLARPHLVGPERREFLDLMGEAFRFRRKTATNALARATGRPADEVAAALEGQGHDPRVRLETLAVAQLVALWKFL
jgi:16S rRNA (adenine1518-N6/adenine1519-N6)-dimethyltransferase